MGKSGLADLIWDRACRGDFFSGLKGDLLLDVLLVFHGCTMNGGLFHALQSVSDRVPYAKEAYGYFRFPDIVELISESEALVSSGVDPEPHEERMDLRYLKLIPVDKILLDRLEIILRDKPGDFAPV